MAANGPEALSQAQKDAYLRDGYLVLEQRIPMDIIKALRAEVTRFEGLAKGMNTSDDRLDLEDSHSPDTPRIRRVKRPDQQSDVFRDLMTSDHSRTPRSRSSAG